jgi:hypothetical protein
LASEKQKKQPRQQDRADPAGVARSAEDPEWAGAAEVEAEVEAEVDAAAVAVLIRARPIAGIA